MEILITGTNISLTDALRTHVLDRISRALTRLDAKIQRIRVRLSDINGDHGGVDKQCHLDLYTRQSRPIVLVETDRDMYLAIDRATRRAKSSLLRRLTRFK